MISLWVQKAGILWYGVAEHEDGLVATVSARTRGEAARQLVGCLPSGTPRKFIEDASPFMRETVGMLARLEKGDESFKRFTLSPSCVPEPRYSVLCAAASIPIGYVSTYGAVAAASGTNARVVGRIMATNPLYPIVACHRVVGSDMSLVGYGGRQSAAALRAKLHRLRAEARGYTTPLSVEAANGSLDGGLPLRARAPLPAQGAPTPPGLLRLLPVERVLAKAERDGLSPSSQLTLW